MTSSSRGAADDAVALDRGLCTSTRKCFPEIGPLFLQEEMHGSIKPRVPIFVWHGVALQDYTLTI